VWVVWRLGVAACLACVAAAAARDRCDRPTHSDADPTQSSLPDNVISAPSLSTFRQRLKTFLFQASFPDVIIDPRFPGSIGSWSDLLLGPL